MYDMSSAAGTPEPTMPSGSGVNGVRNILQRLIAFLEEETSRLGTDRGYDHKASVERKTRMLLELNKAGRSLDITAPDSGLVEELSRLRDALQRNEAKIQAHLTAMREVSSIMVGILKNEEADGTYSELAGY